MERHTFPNTPPPPTHTVKSTIINVHCITLKITKQHKSPSNYNRYTTSKGYYKFSRERGREIKKIRTTTMIMMPMMLTGTEITIALTLNMAKLSNRSFTLSPSAPLYLGLLWVN